MPAPSKTRIPAAALCCCLAAIAGCASWQVPRIDPSGERILIWPNDPPSPTFGPPAAVMTSPSPVATPGAPVIGAPPVVVAPPTVPSVPPTVIAPPFGNVQAPPVYSDPPAVPITPVPGPAPVASPFLPATPAPPIITTPAPPAAAVPGPSAALPAAAGPLLAAAPLSVTPVVPVGMPNIATPLGPVAPAGVNYLRITPAGILVPIGSEVVLKAGVCRADGYLLSNQRVDWTLDRTGVGQFVEPAGREPVFSFSRWNAPQLVDPWTAVGATANVPLRLSRGTADPNDDVQINRGDAWVALTSLSEGTSRVTAYTPALSNFNRATATIYWLDAQWYYPPSASVEAGRPHALTTTIVRRSNGVPLAGWLVRYDVASGASLGYEGGNSTEVPTDAGGRASVEVSPASPGGGAATVAVTIVRPAQPGPSPTPRLEIGRGTATITWGAAAGAAPPSAPVTSAPIEPSEPVSPYTPAPVTTSPVSPPPTAPPTTPIAPRSSDPYTPPAGEPSAGRPQLEVRLRRTGPEQAGVGEFASFEVTVTNRGSVTARRIRLRDRFDTGLRHPSAKPNEFAVEYPGVRDLPPGESATIPLTFQIVAGGTQCHEVTVTAEGAEPVSERGCVTARAAALEVSVTAPRTRVVGEIAQFNVVLKNIGEVAATNVEVVNYYDAALEPSQAPSGHERMADGGIMLRIDRLEVGERRAISTTALCRAPSNRACNKAIVKADGGVTAAAEGCVEILPTLPSGAGQFPVQ